MTVIEKDYVDDTWARDVCKMGQEAACCRYLIITSSGWSCAKKRSELRKMIDYRVMAGTMTAQGDNCPGKDMR
jgi:hypothetical protein